MIKNAARPRGRPRSFDEREALEKATQVFWSKGYDGVTIDDLVDGMWCWSAEPLGFSLRGQADDILARPQGVTQEKKGARAAKALLSPQTLRAALASFLRYIVESATEEGSAVGCLFVCVAPLVDDAEVRQFLQSAAAGAVALMEGRFRDGITAGEIPSVFPVAARAIQVADLALVVLLMRAQIGTPRNTLLGDAEEAADLVLLPRETSHRRSGSARKSPYGSRSLKEYGDAARELLRKLKEKACPRIRVHNELRVRKGLRQTDGAEATVPPQAEIPASKLPVIADRTTFIIGPSKLWRHVSWVVPRCGGKIEPAVPSCRRYGRLLQFRNRSVR